MFRKLLNWIYTAKSDRNKIINYRLNRHELNAVIYKHASNLDPSIDDDISSTSFAQFMNSYLTLKNHNYPLYIFPLCKDAQSENNEKSLTYIGDVIKKFCEENPAKKGLMLIPMRMCRGYLRLPISFPHAQRKHAVLVLVDLEDRHIEVFDSQGWLRKEIYPDKFADKTGQITLGKFTFKYNPKLHYHPFGIQDKYFFYEDVVSCGFYVIAYAKHIMNTGSTKGCDKIKISITDDYKNKWEYLQSLGIGISAPLLADPSSKTRSKSDYEDNMGFVFLDSPPIRTTLKEDSEIILPFEIANDGDLKFEEPTKLPSVSQDKIEDQPSTSLNKVGLFSSDTNISKTKDEIATSNTRTVSIQLNPKI